MEKRRLIEFGLAVIRWISLKAEILRGGDFPVLKHEMRVKFRGVRPFTVMFIYVLVLSIIAVIALLQFGSFGRGADGMSRMGRELFALLSMAQLVMIVLVVPSYSAGTISVEREKGTFPLLSLSLLASTTIITQKLLAAAFGVLMLIVASLPVVAVVFMLGGIAPSEMLGAFVILILTTASLSALGVFCSCIFANTRASTFVTYLVALVALLGVPVGIAWMQNVARMGIYGAIDQSPLLFTVMFAFVGALFAFMVYGILALILRKRTTYWQTRAFRMAVFGGAYALLLLMLSAPAFLEALLPAMGFGSSYGVPIPMWVNPFYAMGVLLMDRFGVSPYGSHSVDPALIAGVATSLFSLGCAYFFQRLSVMKCNALRCS